MKANSKLLHTMGFILVMAFNLGAQELNLNFGEPDVSNFPKVCVPFNVTDSLKNRIPDLNSGMISVYEDSLTSNTVELETIRDKGNNVTILIAVDASKSMRGAPIDSVKSAMKNFIMQVKEEDQIAIISFHDDVETIVDFTSSKDTLINNIDSVEATGSITEMYYGIVSGLKMLNETEGLNETKILIVLSDGKDEGTAYSDDDCIEMANSLGIPIYSIGFHSSAERTYLRVLERISDKTNAHYNDAPTADELKATYNKVLEQIQERTTLCYTSKLFEADSLEHSTSVIVEVNGRKGESSFTFRSPSAPAPAVVPQTTNRWLFPAIIGAVLVGLVTITYISKKRKNEQQRKLETEKERIEAEKKQQQLQDETKIEPEKVDDKTKVVKRAPDPRKTMISGRGDSAPGAIQLYFESGPLAGQSKTLSDDTTIGRGSDNDIVLEEKTVSGHHCRVSLEGTGWVIYDLNSTNGTIVNGSKVTSMMLTSGCLIELGSVKIKVS